MKLRPIHSVHITVTEQMKRERKRREKMELCRRTGGDGYNHKMVGNMTVREALHAEPQPIQNMSALAEKWGVSKQRIHQICVKDGIERKKPEGAMRCQVCNKLLGYRRREMDKSNRSGLCKEHWMESRRTTYFCDTCGKPVKRRIKDIEGRLRHPHYKSKRVFCGRPCFHASLKGYTKPYIKISIVTVRYDGKKICKFKQLSSRQTIKVNEMIQSEIYAAVKKAVTDGGWEMLPKYAGRDYFEKEKA